MNDWTLAMKFEELIKMFDYVEDYYKDGSDNASDTYNSEEGFLYDGACFALYETMGESDRDMGE